MCNKLSRLLDEEYSHLNFSCQSDQECISSDIFPCACQGVNTNTLKTKEIVNIIHKKECLWVQSQCKPFECKCINNACAHVIKNGLNTNTAVQDANVLVGKWRVVSVVENSIEIVNEKSPATVLINGQQIATPGAYATIDFFEDERYQMLGGCNEMFAGSYIIGTDAALTFEHLGGSQRLCERNIVEFFRLQNVSFKFDGNFLLLYYLIDEGKTKGYFKLVRISD